MINDKRGNDIAMFFHDLSRLLSFNEQQQQPLLGNMKT